MPPQPKGPPARSDLSGLSGKAGSLVNLIEYSNNEMIFVKLGDHERRSGEYVSIKHIVPYEKAFTEGYNYNIGKNLF